MSDFSADQAAVVRIERSEEGRWDLTLVSDSGVAIGHGVHLFDRSQDDGVDELAAAQQFVGGTAGASRATPCSRTAQMRSGHR